MKFMFGLQHPFTCKPWTTHSNPCNKVRGEYFSKEVFLCLPWCVVYHCVSIYPVYIGMPHKDFLCVKIVKNEDTQGSIKNEYVSCSFFFFLLRYTLDIFWFLCFDGISNLVSCLIPKPSHRRIVVTLARKRGFRTFLKAISPKVNGIAHLRFEKVYYDLAVKHFSEYVLPSRLGL